MGYFGPTLNADKRFRFAGSPDFGGGERLGWRVAAASKCLNFKAIFRCLHRVSASYHGVQVLLVRCVFASRFLRISRVWRFVVRLAFV